MPPMASLNVDAFDDESFNNISCASDTCKDILSILFNNFNNCASSTLSLKASIVASLYAVFYSCSRNKSSAILYIFLKLILDLVKNYQHVYCNMLVAVTV